MRAMPVVTSLRAASRSFSLFALLVVESVDANTASRTNMNIESAISVSISVKPGAGLRLVVSA